MTQSDLYGQSYPKPRNALVALFESPAIYELTQRANPFTRGALRWLVERHVKCGPAQKVLDIGCGVGTYQRLFEVGRYLGVDINPRYVDYATRKFGPHFRQMDAGVLAFPRNSFDHVMSVATCHHLDDQTIGAMIESVFEILTPTGAFHVFDAVLPYSGSRMLKNFVFMSDRGEHQRTLEEFSSLLAAHADIVAMAVRPSVLHDLCYFRLQRRQSHKAGA